MVEIHNKKYSLLIKYGRTYHQDIAMSVTHSPNQKQKLLSSQVLVLTYFLFNLILVLIKDFFKVLFQPFGISGMYCVEIIQESIIFAIAIFNTVKIFIYFSNSLILPI